MNYFASNEWGKNQYQNLTDASSYQNAKVRSLLSSIAVGLCFALLILSLWSMNQRQMKNTYIVILDIEQPLLQETSPRFLSFGLDSSLLRTMSKLPIGDEKFINLARHLSPAYVRIGGTSADCLIFNQTLPASSTQKLSPVDGKDISNFTITDEDFLALGEFVMKAQINMVFDLNVLLRRSDGSWDNSNAKEIIQFAKSHYIYPDWQLGNEPNSFWHVFNVEVTATQLAEDYISLRELLDASGFGVSSVVGPEVNHIGEAAKGETYAQQFLEHATNSISYVSWHQYYLNGREAQVQDFVNPTTFNILPTQIESMANVINSTGKKINMWLSETSSAYGGGAPELSDRFVAGFLWLDKLGYSASAGLNVVIRQSLFGGNYAMVAPDLSPNPDWWVSVTYKQFVSEKVLRLDTANNLGSLRLYAHCTPLTAQIERVPAVTVYGMNLDREPVKIAIQGMNTGVLRGVKIFLYALTSDSLQSRKIRMNGETLILQPNGDLPPFKPRIFDATQTITLPPYSMVFLVLHGAGAAACTS